MFPHKCIVNTPACICRSLSRVSISNYNPASDVCIMYRVSRVLDRQLLNGCCRRRENCRLCSRPHSHESLIFFVFFGFIFFELRRV